MDIIMFKGKNVIFQTPSEKFFTFDLHFFMMITVAVLESVSLSEFQRNSESSFNHSNWQILK